MAKAITLQDLLKGVDDDTLKNLPFEEGLKLLEELVQKVESGTLSLDHALVSYERGVSLVEHLRKLLTGAEEKLKILQKPLASPSKS